MDRRVGSGDDAAVLAADRFMPTDLCVLKPFALCATAKISTPARRLPLSVEVIGLLIHRSRFAGASSLTAHCVEGDDDVRDRHHCEAFRFATIRRSWPPQPLLAPAKTRPC